MAFHSYINKNTMFLRNKHDNSTVTHFNLRSLEGVIKLYQLDVYFVIIW